MPPTLSVIANASTLGGVSSDTANVTDAESSWALMCVVRSPDSAGVTVVCAAELVHSTPVEIECACCSIMTVVCEEAGLELGAAAGWVPSAEQPDRLTPRMTPGMTRTSRAPPRTMVRPSGFLISGPLLERHQEYRSCTFPKGLVSPAMRQTQWSRPGFPTDHSPQRSGEYGSHC